MNEANRILDSEKPRKPKRQSYNPAPSRPPGSGGSRFGKPVGNTNVNGAQVKGGVLNQLFGTVYSKPKNKK